MSSAAFSTSFTISSSTNSSISGSLGGGRRERGILSLSEDIFLKTRFVGRVR
jgi:hypothetical protein